MTVIAGRFRGPTSSGNGGYTAGVLAACLPQAVAVEVTLRRPPPLERELSAVEAAPGWQLRDGDDLVAEAVAVDSPGQPVPPVDVATARAAEDAYAGLRHHPFPECFVCGPARASGDGMRLAPGRLPDGRTACTWTPDESLAGSTGGVEERFVWAALDCPGGWTGDLDDRPMVLGRIRALVVATPRVEQTYVVVGKLRWTEGRKTGTASSVYDAEGQLCGLASHTWIHIDPSQFR